MKNNKILLTLFLLVALCSNCKKEGRVDYFNMNAPAPAQVSNIGIKARSGGATLTYKIPNDSNFYYAKAVYEIQPNVYREAKASLYTDTLKLEGFGDTLMHEVKIYSVGKNEKESDPISIQIRPLTPPVKSVFNTINIVATFGGVQVSFKNPTKADLAIVVLRDTTGQSAWSPISTFHTGADSGQYSIRGLDSIKQKFAVFIRDRWNNKSDTLQKNLSPIYEEEIPKNTWSTLVLPTDQTAIAESYLLTNLWNGLYPNLDMGTTYASSNASTLPQWFTIDLGEKVIMSRVVEHQTNFSGHCYAGSAPKIVEIWGSNNPNADGSWASWDSLGTFQSFKPSGLPMGQNSDEDINYGAIQGENFEFNKLLPAYRFFRWKTIETYSSPGQVVISEIDIWGQIAK